MSSGPYTFEGFETVIGLEVHAQLKTKTKLFCACANTFGQAPNTATCPVCLGHPGTLPVLNRRAVELAVRLALATGCRINRRSVFARKNYFYPDLPKGYQISQFDLPLAEEGFVPIGLGESAKRIGLVRIHMEEDAGKLLHEGEGVPGGMSAVDFNRGGVPLCEIVGKPEIRSPQEAGEYLRALHAIVRYTDVCDGNMEEGSFRCDANVSVRPIGETALGTRCELKNLNSFRNVERAIEYEVQRQVKEIKAGGKIVQETRTFNADRGQTYSMRGKEEAHDYRYFPEPDLIPLEVDDAFVAKARASLPELPGAKAARYVKELGLSEYDAGVLTAEPAKAAFFERALAAGADAKGATNWITVELSALLNKEGTAIEEVRFAPEAIAELLRLIADGSISGKQAKEVFQEIFAKGGKPADVVKAKGMVQISDPAELGRIVDQVIAANASQVEKFRAGDARVLGFLVGQCMKASGGKANPKLLNDVLKAKLG